MSLDWESDDLAHRFSCALSGSKSHLSLGFMNEDLYILGSWTGINFVEVEFCYQESENYNI
jgi:hypothetical protein